MAFTHDTEVALAAACALVNTGHTASDAPDPLAGPDGLSGLDAFVAHWNWTGSRTHDTTELAAVRALRPRLETMWDLDEDGVVELVNTLLDQAHALPRLVRHGSWPYHLHATSPDQPLADRMAVEAAMAMVDVVRAGELGRLARCAAPHCDDVLVDLSRNRSRRFCDTSCANRVNVAAFRARRAGS